MITLLLSLEVETVSNIRVAGITKDSIVDGPGLRYVVFAQGCYHKCEGCHNPQTHDPQAGISMDTDKIFEEFISNPTYTGITFSGGEPFLQADAFADLAIKIRRYLNESQDKRELSIICYTGYTYEELKKAIGEGVMSYMRLLYNIDYLIDGRFEKDKASLDCAWRGSTNQRIIDANESLRTGTLVEADI